MPAFWINPKLFTDTSPALTELLQLIVLLVPFTTSEVGSMVTPVPPLSPILNLLFVVS